MKSRDTQFAGAARVIEDSLALKSAQSAWAAIDAAIAGSLAVGRTRYAMAAFCQSAVPARVRSIAIAIATACLTHVALTRWMPRRLAPAVPAVWWLAAALAAAAVASAAGPFTNAWRHRR
jgi:hypothetical protein